MTRRIHLELVDAPNNDRLKRLFVTMDGCPFTVEIHMEASDLIADPDLSRQVAGLACHLIKQLDFIRPIIEIEGQP